MDRFDHLVSATALARIISRAVNQRHLRSYCITIACASVLYFILHRENKRRDALDLDESERDRLAFKDLTDKQNSYFRYVL
jgi:hypothetical protein